MVAIKKVLVATGFDPASETALQYGRELARVFHATLDVLHVTRPIYLMAYAGVDYATVPVGLQEDLEQAAARQTAQLVTDEDRRDLQGKAVTVTAENPAVAIIEYAKKNQVDLIVIGTHGRGTVAHVFLGSVAERVVRLAPCPVLTVHHPEHEFLMPEELVAVART
jgi:nucleotide-binding universal stress UspA family protein